VDTGVEAEFPGRGADVDGQPAVAQQTRNLGGEVRIGSGRVVYDDVRLLADDRRLLPTAMSDIGSGRLLPDARDARRLR
jgi:hypothetical protein